MKIFIAILLTFFFLVSYSVAQNSEEIIPYTETLKFSNLDKYDEGKAILEKYSFLTSYAPQKSPAYSMKARKLKRMPNIGLSYENDKVAKTSYVPNQADGWYFSDQKYYVGIYGKHIRKDKEKKGNRHLEQRIYRIEKMKAISHVDVLFDSPAWLEEIYNVRGMVDGKAEIVGCAVLFSDRKNDLKKRILFFDNEMNLKLDKEFESRQKKMFIYDILTNGSEYTVFNSSSAGFLKKGDGEPKYEINIFGEDISTTAMLDLKSQYGTIVRTEFKHMVKLDDESTFMLGNLIYADANQDSNPEKQGNLIYMHLDKTGKLIDSESIPVKAHSEPYIYHNKVMGSQVVMAFGNANQYSEDLVFHINKESGIIKKHFSTGKPSERFVQMDNTGGVIYCTRDTNKKEIKITKIAQ